MTRTILAATICCGLLQSLLSPATAAPLAGNPNAFDNGTIWTGSLNVANGPLGATLEYAVFTAAEFNSQFGGSGYTPTPGQLVYAYQLFGTGSQAITAELIGLSNPVNNIGTFQINATDIDATNALFNPNALWEFDPGIASGETSYGLAFSSPNTPMANGPSLTVSDGDSGTFSQLNFAVPTPGPVPIPEPATLGLFVLAGYATLLRRKRQS